VSTAVANLQRLQRTWHNRQSAVGETASTATTTVVGSTATTATNG
jgi:hypothetical protein